MSTLMRKGPEFIRFFKPIVEVLKSLDGSGSAGEVVDLVVDRMNISDEELAVQNKNGGSRIKNQVHWARNYLVNYGIIDNSVRGIWSLTPKGEKLVVQDHAHALAIFDDAHQKIRTKVNTKEDTLGSSQPNLDDVEDDVEASADAPGDYKQMLTTLLRDMPPAGFEKLCQRLLRESGFKNVKVLGKTGDGGIDGEGLLEVNPLLSFIDGIIELFEKIELGLVPVKTWKVDPDFFAPFYES